MNVNHNIVLKLSQSRGYMQCCIMSDLVEIVCNTPEISSFLGNTYLVVNTAKASRPKILAISIYSASQEVHEVKTWPPTRAHAHYVT